MNGIAFKGHTVFCTDVKASAQVYKELLGFTEEWADTDHVSLLAPVADSPGAAVSLLLHPTEGPQPTDLGSYHTVDVDALVDRARAAGWRVGSEPSDAPWGVREASISDPDGNSFYVTGPLRG